jgi:hypothetical protein
MSTPSSNLGLDRLLAFEADFADRLPCIPMAVRRKLDLAGAKISLAQWSHLPLENRRALLLDPVLDETSASLWKDFLDSSLRSAGAESAKALPIEEPPAWADVHQIPADVVVQVEASGLTLSLSTWGSLDELLRFALVKLSRPGHENRNFLPAAREAGLSG